MKYIAHVTLPAPLIDVRRLEIEAAGDDFARAKALRMVGVKGSTVSVRAVDRSEYEPRFVDTVSGRLLVRAPRLVVNNVGRR